MTKRFTIKPQEDLFGVVDNYSADKVCIINGIRTEIEAEWLCKDMNTLNDENVQLKHAYTQLKHRHSLLHDECVDVECDRDRYRKDIVSLEKENEQLKQRLELYGEIYPTGKWITELNSEELKKELKIE